MDAFAPFASEQRWKFTTRSLNAAKIRPRVDAGMPRAPAQPDTLTNQGAEPGEAAHGQAPQHGPARPGLE